MLIIITIISGDHISSLEVGSDMELENFLALCKMELSAIANVPFEQLILTYSGKRVPVSQSLLKKKIQELQMQDGDAIHIDLLSSQPSSISSGSRAQLPSSAGQQRAPISSLISNLVKSIKVPGRQDLDAHERSTADDIFASLSAPHRLDYFKAEYPELAAAFEANPTDPEAFFVAFKHFKEEMARRARLMQDETSEEGQRYLAEMIERQNIEFMHQFAMEHMPEAFVPVQMLYIRMSINGHSVIAFVDSGAQTSILSESCAKRCNVLRFVDRRFRTEAVGIGGSQKMLGRIHSCQVQVNEHIFPCPFEVMSDRDIDILFGLNTLLRHKCCIDLQKMVLRFGDGTETSFLSEEEVRREKEAIKAEEIVTKTNDGKEGK